jgi:hypothetical protein
MRLSEKRVPTEVFEPKGKAVRFGCGKLLNKVAVHVLDQTLLQ